MSFYLFLNLCLTNFLSSFPHSAGLAENNSSSINSTLSFLFFFIKISISFNFRLMQPCDVLAATKAITKKSQAIPAIFNRIFSRRNFTLQHNPQQLYYNFINTYIKLKARRFNASLYSFLSILRNTYYVKAEIIVWLRFRLFQIPL